MILTQLLLMALPVACVSWTITKEEIFKELRDGCESLKECALKWKSRPLRFVMCKLAYLPTCYYCTSHYVTAIALLMCPIQLLTEDWTGYVFSLFTVVFIAQVYLTFFNLLRVALRGSQAWADRQEFNRAK